jgi:hypothetical protein
MEAWSKPLGVEWPLNLAMGAVLLGAWMTGVAREPTPDLPTGDVHAAGLSGIEDAFARNPANGDLALRLAEAYLEHERPGLAVAVLRSADPGLLEDPRLAHRLAQAYESSGRLADALATADLALARCGRSLGTTRASAVTPVPRHRCDGSLHAALDIHRTALAHMVAWDVGDPQRDPRVRLAYDLAMRRARIASASD